MNSNSVADKARGIMARIRAATAKYDPSYKLKKRGFLNAHDMRRILPSIEILMDGIKIEHPELPILYRYRDGTDYSANDIINTTSIIKSIRRH